LPSARGILLDRDRGVLKQMKAQTQSASGVRRLGVFNAIRNCCFNIADQVLVLSPGMTKEERAMIIPSYVVRDMQ
jgi:hypothetical protein